MSTTLSPPTLNSTGSVAVVVTTYNHVAFLGDAIGSILRQSVAANEIIVIDDGSTDNPDAVISGCGQVRLIHQHNQGLSAARNAGLRAATSEKIIFLDADDRLCPGAIEAGLKCFVRRPEAGFVYGGFRYIDADGGVMSEPICRDIGPDPHLTFLRGNQIGMNGTVMYDRRRLLDTGGFDLKLRRCEDYDLYLRMSRNYPVANHTQTVAEYRWHGMNMSSNFLAMLRSAQRVLARYRPPGESGSAERAWRQGQANWRRYYFDKILPEEAGQDGVLPQVHRLADAVRAAPALTARYLIRCAARYPKRVLPKTVVSRIKRLLGRRPELGRVRFGDLDRTSPISHDFGFDRGTPVDRYYIETFLAAHSRDIQGRALEVGDDSYCRRFGTGILRQDVLHVAAEHPGATIVGDLSIPGILPKEAFDCLIVTQTLHLIYDMHAAVAEMHRALKPDGVLLLTCPGVSQIDRGKWCASWFWSVTQPSARRMFADVFGSPNVTVETSGNVYAAVCFLEGLAVEEIDVAKLKVLDPSYPVIVTVRALKAQET